MPIPSTSTTPSNLATGPAFPLAGPAVEPTVPATPTEGTSFPVAGPR
jgi:hypothetical protein